MELRVGIDAWNLPGDRRGSGRYVREIVNRWLNGSSDVTFSLLVPERFTWLARARYHKQLAPSSLPVRHRSAARGCDVVWFPWNGMSWVAGVTSVATMHDASRFSLAPSDPSEREREQQPFRTAAAHAARIITSSHFSKDELIKYLDVRAEKVDVIHLGVNDVFIRTGFATREKPAQRYILFVGEPEERKGLTTLLEAMARLPERLRVQTELIIAGATGEFALPKASSAVSVRNVGWVSDTTLAALYADAAALAYPSRYEGFGLPIVEAMACGTPVIASDTPSLREAGGKAALYVAPGDAQALGFALAELLGDDVLAARLREQGLERAKSLSWDATAQKTLDVLRRAHNEATA